MLKTLLLITLHIVYIPSIEPTYVVIDTKVHPTSSTSEHWTNPDEPLAQLPLSTTKPWASSISYRPVCALPSSSSSRLLPPSLVPQNSCDFPSDPSQTQNANFPFVPGIELFRLEQRYTRRKNRSTFVSEAQYVDGEYIYSAGQNPRGRASLKGGPEVSMREIAEGTRR